MKERARVYLGSFDAERSWEDPGLARLPALPAPIPDDATASMDELFMAIADDEDVAVTRLPLLPEHVEHLAAVGLRAASVAPNADFRSLAATHTFEPWAITPETAALLSGIDHAHPSLSTVRRVNSKAWSTRLRVRLRLPGTGFVANSTEELLSLGGELLKQYAAGIVLKEPLGVSGRGSLLVTSPAQLERVVSSLRREEEKGRTVELVAEPFHRKRFDFSSQLRIGADGHVSLTSIQGLVNRDFSYAASRPLTDEESRLLDDRGLTEAALRVGRAVAEEGYFGALCIDGMALDNGDIIPLVEVNARYSLGAINAQLCRRWSPWNAQSYLTALRVSSEKAISFAELLHRLEQAQLLAEHFDSARLVVLTARTLPFGAATPHEGGPRSGRLFVSVVHSDPRQVCAVLDRARQVLVSLGCRVDAPTPGWDEASLARVSEKIRSLSRTRSQLRKDDAYASELPEEIGLQLTNRCNLRCKNCYQWSETGFHHHLSVVQQRDELDIAVIESLLAATREKRTKLYLWGGEPLLYRDWDRLVALLEADPRWTVLCTNGIGLESKLDSVLRISANLATLVSLDGFAEQNDPIRGARSFDRIMETVDLLVRERARGRYRGELAVSAVLSTELVPRLYDFVEFLQTRGIDTVYLVFPWFIPPEMATRMDAYFDERFAWLGDVRQPASWHSYRFHIEPNSVDELKQQMERISSRAWNLRVRFQPALTPEEVDGFVRGSDRPAQNRSRCTSVVTRMNVLPDGGVTTCKLFPEFIVGKLTASADALTRVWRGAEATRAREIFACGLTPICSKCVQLYLHGL